MAISTKEQERKALDQIRKIVESLGDNSYLGIAFEGCFDIAEENIDNDWGCSMKQRADKAQNLVKSLSESIETFKAEAEMLRTENEKLRSKVLTLQEAGAIRRCIFTSNANAVRLFNETSERIVELADDPISDAFRDAVAHNREASAKVKQTNALLQRLDLIARS